MTLTNLHMDLNNKNVLQIGSGHGDTTQELAVAMAGGGGRLIVSDISDEHFDTIRAGLTGLDLSVDFIRTSPLKLAGIRPGSVDLVVCNYSLCVINAIVGQGELALHKMYEVLKPAGMLYLVEELPFYMAASPAQAIWAEQRRFLKAIHVFAGTRSSSEYQPDVLEALVLTAGFEEIEITDELTFLPISDWWDDYQTRVDISLSTISNEAVKHALIENLQEIKEKAQLNEGMEMPYVILTAKKPWRID